MSDDTGAVAQRRPESERFAGKEFTMMALATREVALQFPKSTSGEPSALRHAPADPGAASAPPTFRLAGTSRDRLAAFSLAYDKYVARRMLRPNPYRLRVTEFHLLETTAVFVAVRNGRIVGTSTLIRDGALGLPMDAVHPEITGDMRQRGVAIAEASGLAIHNPRRVPDMTVFVGLMRIMAQYACAHGVQQVLLGCIPRHAAFHTRLLGFEQIGQVRPYPAVCQTLGVACRLDLARIAHVRPDIYKKYFGDPLPSATFSAPPMTELERLAFGRAIEHLRRRDRLAA